MNAQQMLLKYASGNNDGKVYTNEAWLGKAITEGVRIADKAIDGRMVHAACDIRREGRTAIVTETYTWDGYDMENRRPTRESKTVEIFRVDL